MSGPANIVNTLKSKIKETADELEKYEGISEETRAKYNTERKAREEIEAEVLSLNRKIKLMEDNMKRHEDRWELDLCNQGGPQSTAHKKEIILELGRI